MARMIDADKLWEKLIEQRDKNKELKAWFHINMGINQAIGIMNSMHPFFTMEDNDRNADNAR